MPVKQNLLDNLAFAIARGQAALKTSYNSEGFYGLIETYVENTPFLKFRSALLSVLASTVGKENIYYKEFEKFVTNNSLAQVNNGLAILQNLKFEVEQGWLTTVKQLITAEIFSDFLEMSEHLLDSSYKDAAAVMIGSVLEEHLRQLCKNHDVDTTVVKGTDVVPKKADLLNQDLAKASAYNSIQQKAVLGWLGLRNSAAHGLYADYTLEQVKLMYSGVLDFIGRTT